MMETLQGFPIAVVSFSENTVDFFDYQDRTRRNTRLLIFYYCVALLLTECAVYTMVRFAQIYFNPRDEADFFEPWTFGITFAVVLGVVGGGTLFKIWHLAQCGGDGVAMMLGGRFISPATHNPYERRLVRVVEEMAIASGIPVPSVYVLDKERRINSFSAGYTRGTVVIGVTFGALETLTRDELQAMVAHEFSHLLNGDTRQNLHLIAILFGLQVLSLTGLMCFYRALVGDRGEDSFFRFNTGVYLFDLMLDAMMETWLFMLGFFLKIILTIVTLTVAGGLLIIGSVGMLFGMLIKSAISRQRAFLADASAVQFTRNPDALCSTLKKIGCPRVSSNVYAASAVEASHMFFASILGAYDSLNLLSTHPGVLRRILRFEPDFDGVFPKKVDRINPAEAAHGLHYRPIPRPRLEIATVAVVETLGAAVLDAALPNAPVPKTSSPDVSPPSDTMSPADETASDTAIPDTSASAAAPVSPPDVVPESTSSGDASLEKAIPDGFAELHSDDVIGMIGRIDAERLHVAEELHHAIPRELLNAVHDSLLARAVMYLVLLNPGAGDRRRQLEILEERTDLAATVAAWLDLLDRFSPQSRIPLVQMAVPSLKQLYREDYEAFRETAEKLMSADGRLDLFEYAFRALLLRTLDIHFGLRPPLRCNVYNMKDVEAPFVLVLSHLAHVGHVHPELARAAFEAAFQGLGMSGSLRSREECTVKAWDAALNRLIPVVPELKRRLLCALIDCVCFDAVVTTREGELIRAICAMLDCPMPMLGTVHNRIDLYDVCGERETELGP